MLLLLGGYTRGAMGVKRPEPARPNLRAGRGPAWAERGRGKAGSSHARGGPRMTAEEEESSTGADTESDSFPLGC